LRKERELPIEGKNASLLAWDGLNQACKKWDP